MPCPRAPRILPGLLLLLPIVARAAPADRSQRVDYLTFARGAVPVALEGASKELGVGMEEALLAVDGDGSGYMLTPKPAADTSRIGFLYRLPALTTFDEFAVPAVLETPSPSQTFVRRIEVAGSSRGPEGPFRVLASATLKTHSAKGQTTSLPVAVKEPVRWVRVSLEGGIDIQRSKTFLEFSEIIGYGSQEPVPLSGAFNGKWKGRGVLLELRQADARVTGCYDKLGDLQGTVSGNLLHATGSSRVGGIRSTFVLAVLDDGTITGVRSTNGAPFRLYTGDAAPNEKTECSERPVQQLGCGSIIHGLRFEVDSATLGPESGSLLESLSAGLKTSTAAMMTVVGHTSSEGSEAYNDDLSQRRAAAVVTALAAKGIAKERISALGRGEKEPIASNATEAGRSLNRRVEIRCR